jgi:erythromycin 3''-O-methyltransferase
MNLYDLIYSLYVHISFMTLIYIIIFLVLLYIGYTNLINTWFVKNNRVDYDTFSKYFIQVASKDNYFMNYGYWDATTHTMMDANENLIKLIFEKSELANSKGLKLLDVGCGYGEQDFEWLKHLDHTNHITAIDISENQINMAKEKCRRSNLSSRVDFQVCDALIIKNKFASGEFDRVICLESAFHYFDRPRFFKGAYEVLKDGGKFVICDIVLSDAYTPSFLNGIFIKLFSDFLNVPKCNLIKSDAWKKSIEDTGLVLEECMDITEKTFEPYYTEFFEKYMMNNSMPPCFASLGSGFLKYVQPFSYKLAICRKPTSV